MISITPTDVIAYCWSIGALLPIFYWLFFGAASKYEGFGLRFFETRVRTFITSESIGIIGTLVYFTILQTDALMLLFLAIFALPYVIIATFLSQELRFAIAKYQAKIRSEEQES